jgi:hypothetical protein
MFKPYHSGGEIGYGVIAYIPGRLPPATVRVFAFSAIFAASAVSLLH